MKNKVFGGICFVLLVVLTGCNLGAPTAEVEVTIAVTNPPPRSLTCDEIVLEAVATVGATCNSNQANHACYGYNNLTAQFSSDAIAFDSAGDIVALDQLTVLSASPLDEAAQTWGIAVIRAQADIPDTLPGENVKFILFGATEISNFSSSLNVFTLRTSFAGTICENAPPSALIMQSPDESVVTMSINGADLTFGSTLYLTAIANDSLTIATIEGRARVTAFGVTEDVIPGTQVRLSLGSSDGLQVISAPSAPEPYNFADIRLAPLSLLDKAVPLLQPVNPPTDTPTPTDTATPSSTPTRSRSQNITPQIAVPVFPIGSQSFAIPVIPTDTPRPPQ